MTADVIKAQTGQPIKTYKTYVSFIHTPDLNICQYFRYWCWKGQTVHVLHYRTHTCVYDGIFSISLAGVGGDRVVQWCRVNFLCRSALLI